MEKENFYNRHKEKKTSFKYKLKLISVLNRVMFKLFLANRFTATIYYLILNRGFDLEHYAVLKGRQAYAKQLDELRQSSPLLRRNIHRLEKGLIMQPRRDIFGEDYILETVQCFRRALKKINFSESEIQWARDVLDIYFSVTKESPIISEAKKIYLENGVDGNKHIMSQNGLYKPYLLSSLKKTEISFDQLLTLFKLRRSVRWYDSTQVPFEVIQKAIDAAALAPSACNRQSYRYIVTTDSTEATKIANCAVGTKGWSHQIPAIIVVIGDLSAYPYERDRHVIYIDASLAVMQLMLAAQTLGLSTCSINWPDLDASEVELRQIINIAEYERVIMMVSIGYGNPQGGIPYSQKKQSDLLVN